MKGMTTHRDAGAAAHNFSIWDSMVYGSRKPNSTKHAQNEVADQGGGPCNPSLYPVPTKMRNAE